MKARAGPYEPYDNADDVPFYFVLNFFVEHIQSVMYQALRSSHGKCIVAASFE